MPHRAANTPSQVPEIVAALRRILTHVTSESSGPWLHLSVTMSQMKVLMLLREHAAMRVGALAQHLNVAVPTITGIVDRLVREGLVERHHDPSDRRVVLSVLTDEGQEFMERLAHRSDDDLNRQVASLTEEEQAAIARALKRLDEALAAAS